MKIFLRTFLSLTLFSLITISCTSDETSHNELDQSKKFQELANLLLNKNNSNLNRSLNDFNPFVDPSTLSQAELEETGNDFAKIYLEIKDEFLVSGGKEEEFNKYFSDKLTIIIADEIVYPIYADEIEVNSCWSNYVSALAISSMDYGINLSGCVVWGGVVNPVCAARAFTEFAQNAWADYTAFRRCIKP